MDQQQFQRLSALMRQMRNISGPVGPLHSFWDDISEAEARLGFIAKHSQMLDMPDDKFIAYIEGRIADHAKPA